MRLMPASIAASPSASAAISTSASASASAAKTASATLLTGSGDVHIQISPLKLLAIKHLDGFLRFLVGTHFNERKSPAFAGHSILDHVDRHNITRLRKEILQFIFQERK